MDEYVITLIAGIAGALTPARAADMRVALGRLGAETAPPRWLGADIACDIAFSGLHPDQADAAARVVCGDDAVDVLAQRADGRRKRLLVADMESTLIRNEMLDELADYVGLRDRVAAITARAMNGELDFEEALDARVALLANLPAHVLDEAAEKIEPMPGARILVQTMRRDGARTVLVSGGFTAFTGRVRAALGLDADIANKLQIANGHLTGRVAKPIVGREAKYDTLVRMASEGGLPLAATLAVGDGANDLAMIEAAGLGVAFHAKPALRARARWRIDHADLTALLYAQGYRREEFVTD